MGSGVNLGLRPGVLERAHDTLRALYLRAWTCGERHRVEPRGLYARELAKLSPEMARLVITLGSPFTGHPRETNAWRLYEFVSGHRIGSHDFHGPLRTPPPVPTTSIWSPNDGIVSWRCSVETRRDLAENIVVDSSHFGLGAHPAALYAIADRLAQPEGHWQAFHLNGWRRLVYRDVQKLLARHTTMRKTDAHSPRWSWPNNPDPSNVHGSPAPPSSASVPGFAVTDDPRATSSCRPCPPTSAEAPRQRRLSPGSRSSR